MRRMMRAMVHRGPDDEGYEELALGHPETGPIAGFGFRRLAILDLSAAGHQPMFHPETGDCLIFNGEIYNYKSLRAQLQCEGVRFRSTSDTEVLLHALSRWGEAAIDRLRGMFAFAFFDANQKRVLLARDPLGIKPLYCAHVAGQTIFASEIRPLLASGLVSQEFDVAGIASMLAYGACQSPLTIHRDVQSFPAASCQWIDCSALAAGLRPAQRFWDFPRAASGNIDERTAVEQTASLLSKAVSRHLVSDVPLGVFLSAGIDSTLITALTRNQTPRVTAFTVGFHGLGEKDESAEASEIAGSLGVEHVLVQVDANRILQAWSAWMAGQDSPSIDGFNTYLVSERLAQQGVVVGLSGLGADELFGGYETFCRAPRVSQLVRFFGPGLRQAAAVLVNSVGRGFHRVGAAEKFADVMKGGACAAAVTRSLRRVVSTRRLESMFARQSLDRLGPDFLPIQTKHGGDGFADDAFNAVAHAEMTHYMSDTLLRDTDANSMQHSLEVRVPFLDRDLVEFVLTLPRSMKVGARCANKALLRKAAGASVPPRVLERPKTGFVLPLAKWMRTTTRDFCESAIDRLASAPFLDGREVYATWHLFLECPESMHWSRPLAMVVLGNALAETPVAP